MNLLSNTEKNNNFAMILDEIRTVNFGVKRESNAFVKRCGVLSDLTMFSNIFLYDHPQFTEKYKAGFQTETGIFINAEFLETLLNKEKEVKGAIDYPNSLFIYSLLNFYMDDKANKKDIIPYLISYGREIEILTKEFEGTVDFPKIKENDFYNELVNANLHNVIENYYGKKLTEEEIKEYVKLKNEQISNVVNDYKNSSEINNEYALVLDNFKAEYLQPIKNLTINQDFATENNGLLVNAYLLKVEDAFKILVKDLMTVKDHEECKKIFEKYGDVICDMPSDCFEIGIRKILFDLPDFVFKENEFMNQNLDNYNKADVKLAYNLKTKFKKSVARGVSDSKFFHVEARQRLIDTLSFMNTFDNMIRHKRAKFNKNS